MTITLDDLAQDATARIEQEAINGLTAQTQYVFVVWEHNTAATTAVMCSHMDRREHLLAMGVDIDNPHNRKRYAYGHVDKHDRVQLAGNSEHLKDWLRQSFWASVRATKD